VGGVHIGVAETAGLDLDDDLAVARLADGNVFNLEGTAELVDDCCFHGALPCSCSFRRSASSSAELFRTHAVRRLAVVRDEQFVGMIAVDDLLMDLAADLADLTRPIKGEVLFAHHDSPVPATR
jgi:hypothetical protein